MNKAVLFYVEQTVPCILFCSTHEHKCLYWLVVHQLLHFSISCVLCTVNANKQAKKGTKIYNKETGKLHSQSRFINCG